VVLTHLLRSGELALPSGLVLELSSSHRFERQESEGEGDSRSETDPMRSYFWSSSSFASR